MAKKNDIESRSTEKQSGAAKSKSKSKTKEKKIISLDHNFSFNLLTEPWLPVVSINAEKQFLSLNDFLKTCHTLERFDFPLPGLETAIIRFLVAIVHIVGAPKDKKEWEEWLKQGKFENAFIERLQKYKDKLDLFSKTEPFMQEAEYEESTIKPVSKLIDMLPAGNNSTHFGNMDLKKDMDSVLLHPSIVLPLLLYCYISARSGLDGDAGINGGATPYNLFINGDTIYHTILLNVIDSAYVENNLTHFGKMAKPSAGWLKDFEKNPVPGDLRIQDILLWKSRKITLIPISMDEAVCVITGKKINHYAIQKISYTKQRFSIIGFQQDIFSGVINDLKDKKKPWKKVKPNGNLPNWRDYSALILNDNAQDQNKKRTAPVVINRLINYNSKYKTNLNLLGIGTNKAKVLQSSENIFVFSNRFSLEEKYQTIISKIILLTRNFDSSIQFALVIALNLTEKIKTKMGKKIRENIQNTFQSAYWHELGSAFEESLAKLAESDKEPDEVLREWKIILAGHVRKTFARHTEKLIANPKHLKHYEAARSYLESRIHKELLPRKTKEASINKGEKNANAIP